MYYDSSGTTTYPSNNAPSGTTNTITIGGTNDGTFPAPNMAGGTVLAYVTSEVSSTAAITFTGNKEVIIDTTSPSCYVNDGHKYYMDVSAQTTANTVPITNGIMGSFVMGKANTLEFIITSATNQNPGKGTKIKLQIYKI